MEITHVSLLLFCPLNLKFTCLKGFSLPTCIVLWIKWEVIPVLGNIFSNEPGCELILPQPSGQSWKQCTGVFCWIKKKYQSKNPSIQQINTRYLRVIYTGLWIHWEFQLSAFGLNRTHLYVFGSWSDHLGEAKGNPDVLLEEDETLDLASRKERLYKSLGNVVCLSSSLSVHGRACVELTTPYPLPTQHNWIQKVTPILTSWPARTSLFLLFW